jgi:hypothetical protein
VFVLSEGAARNLPSGYADGKLLGILRICHRLPLPGATKLWSQPELLQVQGRQVRLAPVAAASRAY